jgi:outer membrane protein OmpA-like peptidoglycan-associated protein/flagellar hook assembly protein FlgD
MHMKKVLAGLAFLTAFALPLSLWAQSFDPPAGASVYYDLYSPQFLAGGASSVAEVSPSADALNPAASGAAQRLIFDLSYLSLIGTTGQAGWGHVLNAGVTWPTRAGVLSGSLHLVSSPFDAIALGTMAALNVSFAKDLFPKLLVGIGVQSQFGAEDWGLGADLGFVHLPGDVGFMKDLRWGIALRGLGVGYSPVAGQSAAPAPFTPAAGIQFDLLSREQVALTVHSDVAMPSFQDLRFNLGTELAIRDTVFLHLGTSWDVAEMSPDGIRDIPLSFGASVKLGTSVKENRSEIKTTAAAAPLQDGIWATGLGANLAVGLIDRRPPEIALETSEQYISPNLDGVQDDLVRSLKITDERFIKGYRFLVFDSTGAQQVREIVNKDERPENVTFKNIVARVLYVKTGITVPEQIRWDGRSDSGAVVADGTYTYRVESWDDNGNVGQSQTGTVIVDNTAPVVEVKAPYLIFSPNGDGNKDTLPVEQSGSQEVAWEGAITDARGSQVLALHWQNAAPAPLEWDGKNSEGILAADGVYSYAISARDQAGNSGSARLDNILIDTQATPINIKLSDSFFSPNGDGVKDTVVLTLEVPVTSGIERWTLNLKGTTGQKGRTFSGAASIPPSIVFDGMDDQRTVLAEGSYVARLEVLYVNGNNPSAESPALTVDLTAPSASASTDLTIFSPDGDGNKDQITIFQETSEEVLWTGMFSDIDGRSVRTVSWRGRADAQLEWGGRADSGEQVPDGTYFYSLKATDRAGNSGESRRLRFAIDTQATEVFLSTDLGVFSPNADGVKDRLTIQPRLKVTEGVASWELRILDSTGKAVRSVQGRSRAPQEFPWDGLDNQGRRLPDGSYRAELVLDYQKGDHHEVRTSAFVVDTVAPTIDVAAELSLFSPDGDGEKDELPVRQSSSAEELWEGQFLDARGQPVRTFFWKGQAQGFRWDGKDENGNKIPDGAYGYRIRSTDAAGNSVSRELRGLAIDTRPTAVFVTVSSDGFSPNGDGVADAIELKPYVSLSEGIQSWTLEMVHAEAGVQRAFSGAAPVPPQIVWDGRKESGAAPEGAYQAVLRVSYQKGNKPVAQSTAFRLDVSAPVVDLKVAPQPFSPDNDGVDDELTITVKVQEAGAVADWRLEILDPVGNPFWSFAGKGMPSERIIWDGLSSTGELVQSAEDYLLRFAIRDRLGNQKTYETVIPVDVLVIRDGDRLKIRISSITFPPNSADLALVAELEKAARNDKTLKRLAEIFKKYGSYRILIEGHANITRFWSKAEADKENQQELIPLSLSRAEAVKRALVSLGLDANRISVSGMGGSTPIVPFDDEANRWKNRRVEFILIKK